MVDKQRPRKQQVRAGVLRIRGLWLPATAPLTPLALSQAAGPHSWHCHLAAPESLYHPPLPTGLAQERSWAEGGCQGLGVPLCQNVSGELE